MPENTSLTVSYHGPAVDKGTMDVQDVGPALLALGTLFNEANSELNHEALNINVHITATSASSFKIVLSVIQSALEKLADLFTSTDGNVTPAGIMAVVFGARGLAWLIKQIRGRKIEKVEKIPNTNRFKMTITEDKTEIEIDEPVMKLFKNKGIRQAINQIVNPVAKEGIDRLQVTSADADVNESVTKGDLNSFRRIQLPAQLIRTDTREMDLEIVSPTFKDNNKWRLSDGETTYSVSIEDRSFLTRIDEGEPFAKGDRLRGHIHITTNPDGKFSYSLMEVIDHRPGENVRQDTFEFEDESEADE